MSKISKVLLKSYLILILIFSLSEIIIFFTVEAYIKKSSADDLYAIDSFLQYETKEFEEKLMNGKSIENIIEAALDEAPKILDSSIIFKVNEKIFSSNYSINELKQIESQEYYNIVKDYGYYNIQYLKRKIILKEYPNLEVYIIKNLKSEKRLMVGIVGISTVILIFSTLIAYFISKKFYNKFIFSLNELQRLTNEINLENLDTNFKKSEFYEFQQVIISYNNMLKRLKEQTQNQIEFVNNASHELKTPIFIISGYINMIKRWGFSNEELVEESLDAIDEETKSMTKLVNKLLFLAKDERNNIKKEKFDLKELLELVIKDLKVLYPQQNIEIVGAEEYSIYSDVFLVKQLLINLVENAIKYGDNKKIVIIIEKNKDVILKIIDRGRGISQENLERIFEKFFREDKARSRSQGSHGLGLAIVKKISNMLGVEVKIESEIGVGSIVSVIFSRQEDKVIDR